MSADIDAEFFEAMVESLGAGVTIYGDDGHYLYVNEAYAALFGAEVSDLVGVAIWEVNPAFEAARFEDYWASFDDRETKRAEAVHEFDGRAVPVETVTTRRTIDGTPYNFGTITDIAERKRRERELEATNERLDSFATVVSHDLRNPLNVAQGYLELLADGLDTVPDELDLIEGALERMDGLISDLLTLARGGESIDDTVPVALAGVARDAWEHVASGDATLRVDVEGTVLADRSRLQQLLENLFRNAVEHGGDAITVGGLDPGFYVADDGPGIDPAVRDRLFEAGVTTNDGGTGFGLSIVHVIADAHGWTIAVEESESGGARFEFRTDGEDASR